MSKFESSQKDESRAQSADSSKVFTVNRELSSIDVRRVIFYNWCRPLKCALHTFEATAFNTYAALSKAGMKENCRLVGQFALEYLIRGTQAI